MPMLTVTAALARRRAGSAALAARLIRSAIEHHLALAGEVLEQQGELVAAEPRDRVHRAQHRPQPLGQPGEQPVAGGVAERVVDLLEVVDVEEQHRDGRVRAPRAVERDAEAVEEQRAVGQAGQRVVQRLWASCDLGALALDRVADRAAQQGRGELGLDQVVLGAGADRRERLLVAPSASTTIGVIGRGGSDLLERRERIVPRDRSSSTQRGAVVEQLLRGVGRRSACGRRPASRPAARSISPISIAARGSSSTSKNPHGLGRPEHAPSPP